MRTVLHRELSFAESKQVLEGRSKEVHNHTIIVSFNTKPVNRGNASYIIKHYNLLLLVRIL